jgi:hypothetical protein
MANWQCPEDWSQWSGWLAAGLHGRCRWRLPLLLSGILFASGRRTVSSWLRAAGVSDDYQDYYYFIRMLGCKAIPLAERLLVLVLARTCPGERVLAALDDSPTKRYGPKVQGAGTHHNPTPGPADQKFVYGHIWVTLALVIRHPLWGTIALPLLAMLYVRAKDVGRIPARYGWTFQTKLVLGAQMMVWLAGLLQKAGKRLWIVVDGAYAKCPFLRPAVEAGIVVVSRLRKDAHLRDLPPKPRRGPRGRGRPRIYGKRRISLAKRAGQRRGWQTCECMQYGQKVTKTYKTFLATYPPACGLIRVVIVKEEKGFVYLFATGGEATAIEILEIFADRASIEQDFHDVKEVWGAGQQQVRNIWTNVGAWHLCLWMHTLVELWAWNKPADEIRDRTASPWDDPERRPSHADRRKALRRCHIDHEFTSIGASQPLTTKIINLFQRLRQLAV